MRRKIQELLRRGAARRSDGSAFIMTLMVLIVLTILGLSLTFATQTEMIVGSNERVTQRAFYAAESALNLAVARTLADRDKRSYFVEIQDIPAYNPGDPILNAGWLLRSRLEMEPVHPVADPPCEYCQINNEYEYTSNAYYKVNHMITVRGSLVGANGEVVAQKVITDMINVEPWDDNKPAEFEHTATINIPEPVY